MGYERMSENPNNSDSAKVAGSGWARPQAMRKDQNRTAWLVLLGLVCLGVATWGVFNSIYWKRRERIQKAALDMAKRTSDSFVAIAYGGVTTNPDVGGDFVSTKKFASQLDALTAAGYTPITLEDVARFYKEGRRLPAKSLLITFENSRRSSYFTTGSLLEKRRWHAVMGVVTDDVRKEVEGVILAPYLKQIKPHVGAGGGVRPRHGGGRCGRGRTNGDVLFLARVAAGSFAIRNLGGVRQAHPRRPCRGRLVFLEQARLRGAGVLLPHGELRTVRGAQQATA